MKAEVFHGLNGENVCFRALRIDDGQYVHSFASDPEVQRFIGWPLMHNLEETNEHIEGMLRREAEGTHVYAAVVHKDSQQLIGTAMMFHFDHRANHAEIGYVLHRNYWGKGYGTETVRMMCKFAFESLHLHKLHARVVDMNIGSILVLKKNGFVQEGRIKDYHFIDGIYYDSLLFGKW